MTASNPFEPQPICIFNMMERLGIEPSGGVLPQLGLRYATAFQRCEACPFKQACLDWLDHTPPEAALPPRFCLNADLFFELLLDPAARRAH
jgi:hypothetical protein